jgi:hypothetical protein
LIPLTTLILQAKLHINLFLLSLLLSIYTSYSHFTQLSTSPTYLTLHSRPFRIIMSGEIRRKLVIVGRSRPLAFLPLGLALQVPARASKLLDIR